MDNDLNEIFDLGIDHYIEEKDMDKINNKLNSLKNRYYELLK